tara:strand:- start:32581 stop:32868 length:288 start_codon:yes stop_codon:yes gene_type:complete
MADFLAKLNPVQRATLVWFALMAATLISALVSVFFKSGLVLLLVSIVILIFKGQMIVDHFMELRHVSKHWRRLMSAYCIVIGAFVILAYLMGLTY